MFEVVLDQHSHSEAAASYLLSWELCRLLQVLVGFCFFFHLFFICLWNSSHIWLQREILYYKVCSVRALQLHCVCCSGHSQRRRLIRHNTQMYMHIYLLCVCVCILGCLCDLQTGITCLLRYALLGNDFHIQTLRQSSEIILLSYQEFKRCWWKFLICLKDRCSLYSLKK